MDSKQNLLMNSQQPEEKEICIKSNTDSIKDLCSKKKGDIISVNSQQQQEEKEKCVKLDIHSFEDLCPQKKDNVSLVNSQQREEKEKCIKLNIDSISIDDLYPPKEDSIISISVNSQQQQEEKEKCVKPDINSIEGSYPQKKDNIILIKKEEEKKSIKSTVDSISIDELYPQIKDNAILIEKEDSKSVKPTINSIYDLYPKKKKKRFFSLDSQQKKMEKNGKSSIDSIEDLYSKKKKNIFLRIFLDMFYFSGYFLILYVLVCIVCSCYESRQVESYSYGTAVDVNGHKMVVDITGDNNNTSIVFFPGFSSLTSVYYRPLAKVISPKYQFISVEPFGYGLSNIVDEERTIDNVVNEFHSCVQQLNLTNYYLMAHSIGGMYSVYYANKYPNEVLGFIGFDMTSPKFEDINLKELQEIPKHLKTIKALNIIGFHRIYYYIKNLILPLPEGVDYSKEEREMWKNFELSKGFNKNIRSEADNLLPNLKVIHNIKFPKHIPVVNYISNDASKKIQGYKQNHIDVGSESVSNEVIELSGGHASFIFQHNNEVLAKLDSLINKKKLIN